MVEIDISDLKMHKFYLLYSIGDTGKVLEFFTLRQFNSNTGNARISRYGLIYNNNPNRTCISTFGKFQTLIRFSDKVNYNLYELSMSDFAVHIVSETV